VVSYARIFQNKNRKKSISPDILTFVRIKMKKQTQVKDRLFELLVPQERISAAVDETAARINSDYAGKTPLFLCILNGSFIFAADLLRRITIPCTVSFVKYSSYAGTSSAQYIKNLIGVNEEISGKDVIIVEDIIDTGLTVSHLLEELAPKAPASVKIAAFCFKKEAFKGDYRIDYLGMEIPNRFVVGYGLDYDGYGRNLPEIYQVTNQ
jgi:hypoxanthine phosphoribosyltransferase